MAAALKRDRPQARLVVVSEGQGRDLLEAARREHHLDQLVLLDYQPYARLPEVLGTADVVVALLEAEAGVFSVPSKVLTYLCAGRPVLGVMPAANQAARMIVRAGAGWVVAPGARQHAVVAMNAALADPVATRRAGRAGRAFAEQTFSLACIGPRFQTVLERAAGRTTPYPAGGLDVVPRSAAESLSAAGGAA